MPTALTDIAQKQARAPTTDERVILILQGPLSWLYRKIGDELTRAGCRVIKINFCVGDRLFWATSGGIAYRGRPAHWRAFVANLMDREAVTDILVHGDRRFYHLQAVEEAKQRGIYIAATELGILRSGWLTLERNGVSTLSHFPCEKEQVLKIAHSYSEIDFAPRFPGSFKNEAVPNVLYHLSNTFFWFFYPHYRRHTVTHPFLDYGAWLLRLAGAKKRKRIAEDRMSSLFASGADFFVYPLQLEGDYQLRHHSPFQSGREALGQVMKSFAAHAAATAKLVVKTHPLDNGLDRWERTVADLAERCGLKGRVVFLDGVGLKPLLERTKGLVTVNSTSGFEALQMECPVKALVPAHFDMEGLTHQGALKTFWQAPTRPDAELVLAYQHAIAATIQVRGSITHKEGSSVGAHHIAARLLKRSLNEPGGYIEPPPRLERARELGCPL